MVEFETIEIDLPKKYVGMLEELGEEDGSLGVAVSNLIHQSYQDMVAQDLQRRQALGQSPGQPQEAPQATEGAEAGQVD